MHKHLFAGLLLLLLSACATTQDAATRAAPERTMMVNIQLEKLKPALAQMMVSNGWTIESDSGMLLSFWKPSNDFWTNVLLGSQYDPTVRLRVSFQLIGDNPVNLSYHAYIVTNPGSAFERLTDVTNSQGLDSFQQRLETLKLQLEAGT